VDDIRERVSPEALMPAWQVVTTLPARLRLSGADIATLSQRAAQGDQEASADRTSLPPQDFAPVLAPQAPLAVPATPLEAPARAGEPASPPASRPAPAAVVSRDSSPQGSTMARLRNDVLVRTALERPVLVGAATIALGALLAALSSAETARQQRTSGPRSRAAKPPSAAKAESGGVASLPDDRLRAEPATAAGDGNEPPAIDENLAAGDKARARSRAKASVKTGSPSRKPRPSKPSKSTESANKEPSAFDSA